MDGSPNKTVRAQALCRHTVQIIPSWACRLRVSSAVGKRVYPLRPTKGGQVYFGRFYKAKRQRGPVSRCDETGPLWGAMRVWRRGVYRDAATGVFPQIKPAKINLSLNDRF